MARETNWVAVGAVAGVASAFVALLAYTVPPGTVPNPTPTPTNSSMESSQNTAPPTSPGPGPSYTQPAATPAGCQEGLYAVNTYYQTVGSTPSSEAHAAERALNEIMNAMEPGATGNVAADLESLENDFGELPADAMGENGPTSYAQQAAATSTDAQLLKRDCNAG